MGYRGTVISGGVARQKPLDLGDANVWRTATTGTAGTAAIRTAAGANLGDGDILVTGYNTASQIYWVARADGGGNIHVLPVALPNGESLVASSVLGFDGQIPSDGDWTESNTGSGGWTESSGLVTATSPTTGSNRARAIAGDQTADTVLIVVENLSGTLNSDNELELIGAVSTSNRYVSLRNTSGNWNVSGTHSTGQAVTSANTLEMLCDGPGNLIYYRWGRTGSWTSQPFTSTFALSLSARWNAQSASAGNPVTISMDRCVVCAV